MTTEFLNFARPQALQLEESSLNELIEGCARELRPLFESRNVELVSTGSGSDRARGTSSTASEGSLDVRADPRMLRQAFLNLIRNAAGAISEARRARRVTMQTSLS